MRKTVRPRFIAFCLKKDFNSHSEVWGVLNRLTGELMRVSNKLERYPEVWARERASQLNKDYEHEQTSSTKDGKTSKGP